MKNYYWISFKMSKSDDKIERCYSNTFKTTKQWNEYFERKCGGVYKWWRE
jgi:hypothetical protein